MSWKEILGFVLGPMASLIASRKKWPERRLRPLDD